MDELEQLINQHRDQLQYRFEGMDGSWSVIQQQLKPDKPSHNWVKNLGGIAAAIALGLMAVWGYTQYNNRFMLSAELTASINYYEETENQLLRNILQNTDKLDPIIQGDLDEIEATRINLIQGLPFAPADQKERIINSLVQSYELKIEMLKELLISDQLEKSFAHEDAHNL
ncbi:hypothetical protein [Membranihabitans marinus]|uniref:hypothetical protein n=1 Tax=Membranihabitans marinus TaxID=1227546 RepID=UPI001F22904A|nr:hypothetical protein [Membranihabitans marinus]